MGQRIFLAGAAGVVGRRLIPLLRGGGHHIVGTTRAAAKQQLLRDLGAEPVIVDVFDAETLSRAIAAARPDIVIHQLTDLPQRLDPAQMPAALVRNARIRAEGTGNLVTGAIAAGAYRFIAQSVAWMYAPGPEPHAEGDPLDEGADGSRATTVHGVVALENHVLHSPPLEGIVLRYGQFYGPGTGLDAPKADAIAVHVDAAAYAALLAVDRGAPGVYNIAELNMRVATQKARSDLGWHADFRGPA